jgi:6-phosphogluconolactonase
MRHRTSHPAPTLALAVGFVAALLGLVTAPAGATSRTVGAVYTLSNATAGNAVVVFARHADGSLSFSGTFPTTGAGTGESLGDQGALVLQGRRLLAVDAGSNEITAFRVGDGGLALQHLDTVPSGGVKPISVTLRGHLAYVLNAGDASHPGNVVGFRLRAGNLHMIPGSLRPLSADAVDPAQIQFTPDGRLLFVTEKATNLIDTYTVDEHGMASGPVTHPSSGTTPFGFAVRADRLFVSEAFGGAPDASALSSYRIGPGGSLSVSSASVPTTETAACWVVVTPDGDHAYVTNTGSASISGYRVHDDGRVRLLDADGVTATTGSTPIDLALAGGGRFLYSLDAGAHAISGFAVHDDGSLVPIGSATGLPVASVGLAAR